ncbi:MAG: hypothetical protein SGILL_001303 [Bacillariaceae sp.]
MGELTGELAEGYKRLMEKKKKHAGSTEEDVVVQEASAETAVTSPTMTMPVKTPAKPAKSNEPAAASVAKPPSSTTGTRKGDDSEPLAANSMRRRSFIKNRSKDRLAKFNQQRNSSMNKEKENKVVEATASEDDMKEADISHVSSNVSTPSMQHVSSTVSVDTRRVSNTSPVEKSPPRATQLETTPNVSQPELETKTADDSQDTDDTFPSLDWKEIEREAKSVSGSDVNTSEDKMDLGPTLVVEEFNPQKDNVSVTSSRSGRSSVHSGRQLNAILEEQAEIVFGADSGKESKSKATNDEDGFAEAYEAIQFNPEDAHVSQAQQTKGGSSNASGPNEDSPSRVARAYHRPHTGEKVVIIENQQVTVKDAHALGTVLEHDDGGSKSDTSGLPSWASQPSVKKPKKKSLKSRPKRRPRKVSAANSVARKDGDPLGRAVSVAFDHLAGYAGLQEDVTSATGPHDEFTVDEEEYMSDDSENIIADIRDALFSTFGCSVPRTRHRQLNDDDTLGTDGGSKVSIEQDGRFIRHTRSGSHASDSMGSEPSLNIPTMPSYDENTDEGTLEDDGTERTFDSKTPYGTSITQDSFKSIQSTPKYKVPEEFDAKPPSIPRTFSSKGRKLASDKSSASVYSDSTGTYRKFVEHDHDAVNLLEDADTFFFGKDAKKDIVKVGKDLNKNVGEFVASIQNLLNPVAPTEGNDSEDVSSNAKDFSPSIDTTSRDVVDSAEPPSKGQESAPESAEMVDTADVFPNSFAMEESEGMEAIAAGGTSPATSEPAAIGDELERSDSLFAAAPKTARSRLDTSSETGSDNTLEELKMMLIEEARQMAPIDFASESAMSTAVEEEKKEEDSHTDAPKLDDQQQPVEEFEFDETLFAQAHQGLVRDGESAPASAEPLSSPAFKAEFEFGDTETAEDNLFPTEFGAVEVPSANGKFEDAFALEEQDTDQIEVSHDDEIIDSSKSDIDLTTADEGSSDPEQNLAGEGIELDDLVESQDREIGFGSVEMTMEPNISSVHEVEEPAGTHPNSFDEDDPQEISFESVEVSMESIPPPPSSKDCSQGSVKEPRPTLAPQFEEKKKKKGVMKGLLRSFKRNKDAKPSKSVLAKSTMSPPGANQKKEQVAATIPNTAGQKKAVVAPTRTKSLPPKRSTAPKLAPTPGLNNLMESYLSEKFDKSTDGSAHNRSVDPWGGKTAKSASEVPKQRNDAVPVSMNEPFNAPVALDRKQHLQDVDQFGFAVSVPNDYSAENDFGGWDLPESSKNQSVFRRSVDSADQVTDTSSSAAFATPDRTKPKVGTRIPNTPVKWESVQDSSNEGIDLRAESKSTSSSGYSQPPAVDWGAVFEKTAKIGVESLRQSDDAINTSPQKVSDFPEIESQESHASF